MNSLFSCTPILFTLIFLAIFFPSIVCAQDLSSKMLPLPTFTAVSLETVGDLIIENDTKHSFTIEAEPKVIAAITASVDGNLLRIFSNKDFKTQKPIHLKVSLSKFNEISLKSSGDIVLEKWKTDKLDFLVFGSGSIKASMLNVGKTKAKISGSGDISLVGQTVDLQTENEGTGTIETSKLITSTATATISGSGDINLHVTNRLKANITGSGNINYQGNPKVTSSITGAGEIIKTGLQRND